MDINRFCNAYRSRSLAKLKNFMRYVLSMISFEYNECMYILLTLDLQTILIACVCSDFVSVSRKILFIMRAIGLS